MDTFRVVMYSYQHANRLSQAAIGLSEHAKKAKEKSMKKYLLFFASAFLLSAITSAHATMIVYGTINGVVASTTGSLFFNTRVGMPVTGTFSYDLDLLSPPDSSGLRTAAATDLNTTFYFRSSVGEGGGCRGGSGFSFNFLVDPNGLPYSGNWVASPDGSFTPTAVGVSYQFGVYWDANVTYTINGVSDAGATWILLGLGLASVAVARRCFRQTPV